MACLKIISRTVILRNDIVLAWIGSGVKTEHVLVVHSERLEVLVTCTSFSAGNGRNYFQGFL